MIKQWLIQKVIYYNRTNGFFIISLIKNLNYFIIIMELNSSRKYNNVIRRKLVEKLEKIKDKTDMIELYTIIYQDINNNFSVNRNGIFINMNILSDNCIEKLYAFIEDKLDLSVNTESEKINYTSYKADDIELISKMGHKLSNQEKNIIKRIRNKIII